MRIMVAYAAGALLALSAPVGSAYAAMPLPAPVQPAAVQTGDARVVQADWDGRPGWHGDWHHHWHHEWRDHWHPAWHPYWHHHWHHHWDRPYGYQY
jgi:hypothetical protein